MAMPIPETGSSGDDVLATLRSYKDDDADWQTGRSMTNVYLATEEARRVAEEAYSLFLWENALDLAAYQSIPRLEREVTAMAAAHLGGDDSVVGSFTTGGTESCLMAVKAARDWSRANGGPERPEIVLSTTTHACFHKAAHYYGLDVEVVPVDPTTFRADVAALAEAISDRTILLVASAPSYPHGVVDPIAEIGELALDRSLLFHVDACIGGFALPFFADAGADIPAFDLSVPGVSSISMDFHKYALCAKGASVVLYRDPAVRRHQFFTFSDWPSYVVLNTVTASSKTGGPLAATWATLNHFGRSGYREIFGEIHRATGKALDAIAAHPHLSVLGEPDMSIFAITSDSVDVFDLGDAMKDRGWDMYPQLGYGDIPPTLHVTLMPRSAAQIDAWIDDMADCVRQLEEAPREDTLADVRAMIDSLDLESLSVEELEGLMAAAGIDPQSLGGAMADVNRLLDDLPPAVCDRVLAVFLDHLTRPATGAPVT